MGGILMKIMKSCMLVLVVLLAGCTPRNNGLEQSSIPQTGIPEILEQEIIPYVIPVDDSEQSPMPEAEANPNRPKEKMIYIDSFDRIRMVQCVMLIDGTLQRSDSFSGGAICALMVWVEPGYFREEGSQNVIYVNAGPFKSMEDLYRPR
jgi:hypothetical protein